MKIYIVLESGSEYNSIAPILTATGTYSKAIDKCYEYLRDSNTGENRFWLNDDDFEDSRIKHFPDSKEDFVNHFSNGNLISAYIITEELV